MKSEILCFSAALLLFCTAAVPAAAETEPVKGLTTADGMYAYGINEEGNAEIYDLIDEKNYTGDIVIPSEIDGHAVVYVGNGAFTDADGITSVTIPKSVTDMGDCVFFGCRSLSSITVEEGNPYFSVNADGVLMGDGGKFLFCYPPAREGTAYVVPEGVDELAPGCFGYAKYLQSVIVPSSVYSVDRWAFAYTMLESVTLENGVYQLDDYAFAYSQSLHEVNLGDGLSMIYDGCFANCRALTEITLPESLTYVGQYAFCGTSMKNVTIPAGVEEISYGAFGYDSELKPISGFTVYGTSGTPGHLYCTAVDEENEYENHFNFVSVDGREGSGTAASDSSDASGASDETAASDDGEDAEASEKTAETDKTAPAPRQKNDNSLTWILLIAGVGVIVLLIAVLSLLLKKKPQEDSAETDDPDEPEDAQQGDEE